MLLVTNKSDQSSTMTKSPTPRGWTKVQEIMNQCSLVDKLLIELISGIVGPVAAASFVGFRHDKNIEIPSSVKIIADYATEKNKVIKLVNDKQLPVLTKVIEKVVSRLDEDKIKAEQVNLFLQDLPEELQLYFYKLLSRDNKEVFDYFSDEVEIFEQLSELIIETIMS